jgi:asparagine synthetase B (glutamine-hydrolysing)
VLRVRAMAAAMRHRAADEEGFLAGEMRAPGLALGMRLLNIIDLTGWQQPVWNETRDAEAKNVLSAFQVSATRFRSTWPRSLRLSR